MDLSTSNSRTKEFNKVSKKKFYQKLLPKNPIIIDVGANKGQTIDFFLKIFSKPKIYAFEPSDTYKFIKNKYKSHKNIETYNPALFTEL